MPLFTDLWATLRDVEHLFDDVNRNLRHPLDAGAGNAVNIYKKNDGALAVTIPVPGVSADRISTDIDGQTLVVRVEPQQDEPEAKQVLRQERRHGSWERRIRLSHAPDADQVHARLRHGVLAIAIPAPAKQEAKRIAITTE